MSGVLPWVVLLALLDTPPPGAAPPGQRALVLPVRVPPEGAGDLRDAAPGIERVFKNALGAHAQFSLLTHDEVTGLLARVSQDQLSGCDQDSCMAELADLLDVDLVVTSALNRVAGVWILDVGLLDRRAARTVRRASTRAASLPLLLTSLEVLARQLAGGSSLSGGDPRLQERLGTNAAGVGKLRRRLAANPDADLSRTWTDLVIENNRESRHLAMAEGSILLAAGLAGAVLVPLQAAAVITLVMASMLEMFAASRHDENPNPRGLQVPALFAAAPFVFGPVLAVVGLLSLGTLAALAIIDRLDLGRIAVARAGCCRDAERIAAAERPDVPMRLAPLLAGTGGALAVGTQLGTLVAYTLTSGVGLVIFTVLIIAIASGTIDRVPMGPTITVPVQDPIMLVSVVSLLPTFGVLCATLPVGVAGLAASLVMTGTGRDDLAEGSAPTTP